ncbi:PREDICTED: protein FAM219B [Aptenodytes forsteri]|uniref:protein FAM219B n=1 Tax=Aptenodytes forsteri TaxID=9233 RepID=UPI000905C0E0|nr:PREDICTED: protein FAM219B [Aptenodytes forsteri]
MRSLQRLLARDSRTRKLCWQRRESSSFSPGGCVAPALYRSYLILIRAESKRLNKPADAVEKRGPYIMSKPPSIHAKLRKRCSPLSQGLCRDSGRHLRLSPRAPLLSGRSVKFNKGYTALSQTADENLVSLDSDSDGELGSRCSSGYSSAEVNQDLSRQLLQDGYHLDEVPDDEDLDLILPKPIASSSCPCCFGENLSCVIQ